MKHPAFMPWITLSILAFTILLLLYFLNIERASWADSSNSTRATMDSSAPQDPVVLKKSRVSFPSDITAALFASLEPASPLRARFSEPEAKTAKAAVNIVCKSKTASVPSISGSGVIIDPRGIVLTNAHVAQLFLLSDYPREDAVSCTVRQEHEDEKRYEAQLLFLPTLWMETYAHLLTEKNPRATGEYDFALLYLSRPGGETGEAPRTEPFPFVPLAADEALTLGDVVLALAYPAPQDWISSFESLPLTSTITTIHTLFTFRGTTLDLFAVRESSIAERGSSGGAIVNERGDVVGIIVNRSSETDPALRDARAITASHIHRTILAETGTTSNALLSGNVAEKTLKFQAQKAPGLSQLLVAELLKIAP